MNRLIHKTAAGEMSLCDINHRIVPLTEVPTEYLGYTSSWDEDFAYAQLNLRYSESEMDSHEVLDTYER